MSFLGGPFPSSAFLQQRQQHRISPNNTMNSLNNSQNNIAIKLGSLGSSDQRSPTTTRVQSTSPRASPRPPPSATLANSPAQPITTPAPHNEHNGYNERYDDRSSNERYEAHQIYSQAQDVHNLSQLLGKPNEERRMLSQSLSNLSSFMHTTSKRNEAIHQNLQHVTKVITEKNQTFEKKMVDLMNKETKARNQLRLLFLHEITKHSTTARNLNIVQNSHTQLKKEVENIKNNIQQKNYIHDEKIINISKDLSEIILSSKTKVDQLEKMIVDHYQKDLSRNQSMEDQIRQINTRFDLIQDKIVLLIEKEKDGKKERYDLKRRLLKMEGKVEEMGGRGLEWKAKVDAVRDVRVMRDTLKVLRTTPKRL